VYWDQAAGDPGEMSGGAVGIEEPSIHRVSMAAFAEHSPSAARHRALQQGPHHGYELFSPRSPSGRAARSSSYSFLARASPTFRKDHCSCRNCIDKNMRHSRTDDIAHALRVSCG
jgi:hypothetical protein